VEFTELAPGPLDRYLVGRETLKKDKDTGEFKPGSSSRMSEAQVTASTMVDVTSLFREAAESLTVVDSMICKEKSFSLQDSMSALEIMDRKMDCCEIPAGDVAPFGRKITDEDKNRMVFPRPLPTGLEDAVDPLPWNELTMEAVAYISLECLSRFESLLGGSSVVESTYTCLYAHKSVMTDMKSRLDRDTSDTLSGQMQRMLVDIPETSHGSLSQRALYASILLLLDLTDVVRNITLSADIFEEEDFTVSTYNIPVFEDRGDQSSRDAANTVLECLSSVSEKDSEAVQAIRFMLEFQVEFLNVCDIMSKLSSKDVRKETEKSQKLIRVTATKLEKLSTVAKRMKDKESDAIKALLKRTFDSYVTRPLVGNAPVRKVVFLEIQETISSLIKTTKELDWALCGVLLHGNSIGRIRRLLSRISSASVNVLPRSLLILSLYFNDQLFGQYSLSMMIMRHMQQLSYVPDDVFQTPTSQAFLGRLAKPLYDVLKVMILNRNRQRAYIEGIIFPDWGVLSQEAVVADATLQQDQKLGPEMLPHFSLYTLYLTVDCMDHFVALGIELGLHCSGYELSYAYWYRDFLLSTLLTQLNSMKRARLATKQAHQAVAPAAKRGKKKGAKNSKKPLQQCAKPEPQDTEDDAEFILMNMKRVLCRGLVRVSPGFGTMAGG
jgi:hypothetical protein